MMNYIYSLIDKKNPKTETKNRIFLIIWMVAAALLGMIVWAAVGRPFLENDIWMFVFMGYSAIFIGFFGGVLFLYNKQ